MTLLSDMPKKTKRCPRCRKIKEAGEFYKSSNRPDGLSGYCKRCKDFLRKHTSGKQARKAPVILSQGKPGDGGVAFARLLQLI